MALQWSQYSFMLILLPICFVEVAIANSLATLQPSCSDHERSALLQFKHNFIIDCDASHPDYSHPTTSSWAVAGDPKDGDCCLWKGVKCNKETGHVIGLDLSSSCLHGTFPSNTTLFNLHHLEVLVLSGNNFNNSPIPSELGHQLSKLTSLNLSSSAFSGQVPSGISKLTSLSLLDLSHNHDLQLKPLGLKRLVQNLTRLNQIILNSVDISSPVPNLLANLTSLKTISLPFCNLLGEFPTSIFHLPHLEKLVAAGNKDLTGVLPEFAPSSPLKVLTLPVTSFSGELPPSIGSLAHMEVLDIFGSMFSGQVPSSLGNLTKLIDLSIAGNNFSGDMPTSITNITQLQYLGLSDLNFRPDNLFTWLSKLDKLFYLNLMRMNLNGQIPSILANSTSLTKLALDDNHITGHIPDWLMNLTQLSQLSLPDNHLEGSLSPRISQFKFLETLDLAGNNNLHANLDTLLKLRYLKELYLSGLTLIFHANISANESVAKLTDLVLKSCNLTEFPPFLRSHNELKVLDLSDNRIQGAIPLWFVNVTRDSLLDLDLSLNFLTGFEQPTKVLPWDKIEILELDGNRIQGSLPIPSNSMVIYHISNNSLTGDIPHELCHVSAMKQLDLSFNHLGGRIPKCIGNLGGSIEILNLQGNTFHGTVPHVYPKSCKLKMINLSKNQLTGNMPRSLVNCRALEVLDIGENQVNDTFPSWLGSLPNLQSLVLRHNNFHGRIGRLYGAYGFHSLRIMDLSHNFHIGSIPPNYLKKWHAMKVSNEAQSAASGTSTSFLMRSSSANYFPDIEYNYTITIENKGNDMLYPKILTILRVIDFSSNNFTGRIPAIIGELKGLQSINLSNNNLIGGIPSSLASIRDLQSLDLSNNKLSGEIPQQLTQLTFLEVYNVSHNLLVGPTPQGNQFDTFDNSSFDGNLGLCGGTLCKKCGNVDEPPPSASLIGKDKEDNSNMIDWIIRTLGCVSGFVIGYVIGKDITDRNHEWFVETFRGRNRRTKTKPRRRS